MVEASDEVYSSLHRRFKGDLLRPGQIRIDNEESGS
jgi:hypothetical protein